MVDAGAVTNTEWLRKSRAEIESALQEVFNPVGSGESASQPQLGGIVGSQDTSAVPSLAADITTISSEVLTRASQIGPQEDIRKLSSGNLQLSLTSIASSPIVHPSVQEAEHDKEMMLQPEETSTGPSVSHSKDISNIPHELSNLQSTDDTIRKRARSNTTSSEGDDAKRTSKKVHKEEEVEE